MVHELMHAILNGRFNADDDNYIGNCIHKWKDDRDSSFVLDNKKEPVMFYPFIIKY